MENGSFKKVFLAVGGAAAGANVATLMVASIATVVPPFVPILGAVVLGSLALAASKSEESKRTDSAPAASD